MLVLVLVLVPPTPPTSCNKNNNKNNDHTRYLYTVNRLTAYADSILRLYSHISFESVLFLHLLTQSSRILPVYSYTGTSFVPLTANVEVLPFHLPASPFRGIPLSIPEIEQNCPDIVARWYHNQSRHQQLPFRDTNNSSKDNRPIQCHTPSGKPQIQEEIHMSQRPDTSRPSSSSPHDRSKCLPSLGSRTLPPIHSATSPGLSQNGTPIISATQNVSARPTPPPSSTPPDQRSSRPIGVQNLLNPTTSGEITSTQSRRRNAEHLDSPPRASPLTVMSRASTPSLPSTSISNRSPVSVTLPSITPPLVSTYPQPLVRAMTPHLSPSSYGPGPITMNNPSGTMDVKQSPFVLPRDHNGTGGRGGLPDIATATSLPGESYSVPLPPARSPSGRRNSQDSTRYSHMQNLLERKNGASTGPHSVASQGDSPSTQYSSYSHVSQTPPPAPPPSTGQPQSFFTAPFTAPGPASTMAQMGFDAASNSTAGGSTYQMMTLDTEQGPIQVPVDVQAASKVADEKRKRNATASHRFRQRRKEKERENSQNIAKLEDQIRQMEEEREYYRRERDYFREVAVRQPGQSHVLPRPVSPRQRRHTPMTGSMGYPNVQFEGPESGNRNGGRNTRRRTSGYVPATGPPPQSAEPARPMPQYERMASNAIDHAQGGDQTRLPLKSGPFDSSVTR